MIWRPEQGGGNKPTDSVYEISLRVLGKRLKEPASWQRTIRPERAEDALSNGDTLQRSQNRGFLKGAGRWRERRLFDTRVLSSLDNQRPLGSHRKLA